MTLESKIAKFKRLADYKDELKSTLATVAAQHAALESEIIAELLGEPEAFAATNAGQSRRISGRYSVSINYAKEVARSGRNTAIDDQDWLAEIAGRECYPVDGESFKGTKYVRTVRKLRRDAIRADLNSGVLGAQGLKLLDLEYEPTAHLKVERIKSDSEIEDLVADATALADDLEHTTGMFR